jgi:hypothetical protein
MRNKMLKAAVKELEAKEAKAQATIELYLYKAVAIADHSEVIDEIAKWANYGAEARDAKEYLRSNWGDQ